MEGPRLLEGVDRGVLGVEEVHHLVAERRHVAFAQVGLDGRRRGDDLRLGQRPTVDRLEQRVEQQREPLAAGVDHPGLGEDRKELGRSVDGVRARTASGRGGRRARARSQRAYLRGVGGLTTTVRIVPSTGRITAR